ncbi:MAG: hypothetical protein GX444_17965 [Myxococcales bacterium]|nr:hypothetical protein [Myxococcales bacterium]
MKAEAIFSVLVLLGLVLCFYSCADDDDDDAADSGDDDENDEPEDDDAGGDDTGEDPECAGNAAPEFLGLQIWVNGQPAQPPISITTLDQLEFGLEYDDADCNLDGGGLLIEAENGNDESLKHFSGLGCSSEENGGPARFAVDPGMIEAILDGAESAELKLVDVCGDSSEPVTLEIQVEYQETDCSANTAPELIAFTVLVGGETIELPGTVGMDDEVVVRIEYADNECNLDGGTYYLVADDGIHYDVQSTILGIGCSSEADGPFDLIFRGKFFDPSYGQPFFLGIQDDCGDTSNELPIPLIGQ